MPSPCRLCEYGADEESPFWQSWHWRRRYKRNGIVHMTFAAPMRVNREAGSAIAAGNIRGAQLALRNGPTRARQR
jgi:hypothetical protein